MPPLRQAALLLAASGDDVVVERAVSKRDCDLTTKWKVSKNFNKTVKMNKLIISLICGYLMCAAKMTVIGQTVVVNSDGTHSVIVGNVIVNPDGTHSTIHGSGNTKVVVNSDGTHSTVHGSGNTKVVVNSDGTHSTVHGSGSTKVVVNPDGTHSTVIVNSRSTVEPSQKEKEVLSAEDNRVEKRGFARMQWKRKQSRKNASR